ncbi:hypothetical protein [uncultured Enterococcus sp.]|uniref:hypothetical protein n=1 Tax=uncultured Enterococcus sp. TaxID=167972 RepID=UPI002AA8458F|nr:hypothetical protein [uncultured Enterococcus sp.]
MTIVKMNNVHPDAVGKLQTLFSSREQEILKYWSNEFYITHVNKIELARSSYKFFLVKPSDSYTETLGLSREILVVFSDYKKFEPRTLDAAEEIYKRFQEQRCEKICYILISDDNDIKEALKETLSNEESQIIVPFTYESFSENKGNQQFIRNCFRENFNSRDLFDISTPLKKDLYFFGRDNIVMEIVDKHTSSQNYGLFGLRKTGKTSIIYGVIRKLKATNGVGILVDCQDTKISRNSWNHALYEVLDIVAKKTETKLKYQKADFSPEEASNCFHEAIIDIHKQLNEKTILLLFDEIENITFEKSADMRWREGFDFIYFWQTIRSVFQQTDKVFTFCILGTNPKCVEVPSFKGADNPIFQAFDPRFIPGFDVKQTRNMVRKLGRFMGLSFDEGIYSRLQEDYGGHPFLIRKLCSIIAKQNAKRPAEIDRLKYGKAKQSFEEDNTSYFDMLLDVLKQYYPEEFKMLEYLSIDDNEEFSKHVSEDSSLVRHLVGYGIIRKSSDQYDFCIDSLKSYVQKQSKIGKKYKSKEDKWQDITVWRNNLEIGLRKMVRITLLFKHGEAEAKKKVIKKLYNNKQEKYNSYSYASLFDPTVAEIYFRGLGTLINSYWDDFSDYFENKEDLMAYLQLINSEGRPEAHAAIPNDENMELIRIAITKVQLGIDNFENRIS